MAIWKGLWLAKQKGFRRVIIELDSSEAFELHLLLQEEEEEEDETRPNFDIIRSFCVLMEKGCEYEFCNVLGEANLCADLMAQEAWHSACDEEFIQPPPSSVRKRRWKRIFSISSFVPYGSEIRNRIGALLNFRIDGSKTVE
ncbi:hypothetical protein RHSIM_Rhsim06G0023500 [Rhododendron simsii]|uniref:RNase H type-1 domain-containing protein n=1 Tax=Rhododendron simsii TaxID=118357 RepID=A0A834H360_RHOSS|nr:hypothetical protein RHSIM_Rhsim06G0023500 [Rhododendron simsii]